MFNNRFFLFLVLNLTVSQVYAQDKPMMEAVDKAGHALVLAPIVVDTPEGRIEIMPKSLEHMTDILRYIADFGKAQGFDVSKPEIKDTVVFPILGHN